MREHRFIGALASVVQGCVGSHAGWWLFRALVFAAVTAPASTQASIDGGRSDLPGMKQDIFDQVQRNKKSGPAARGKGPPECPKSDKMSPFLGLAFANGEVYVRINDTVSPCQRLITVAGANFTVLANASKTCGPAGEWKKRIAEELSAVFFQGGLEWVRSENETLEVITDEGTFQAIVSEEKYQEQLECWKRGCGCDQAKNPKMRMVFMAVLVISVGGLGHDSLKLAWEKVRGKKPAKHVECKKGHRMTEVKLAYSHHCDICGVSGTTYQCCRNCNYDMCKKCYKESRRTVKAAWKDWVDKHPEDEKERDKQSGNGDKEVGSPSCSLRQDDDEVRDDADLNEISQGEGDAECRSEPESTTVGAAVSSKAASEAEQDEESKDDDKKDSCMCGASEDGGNEEQRAMDSEGIDKRAPEHT